MAWLTGDTTHGPGVSGTNKKNTTTNTTNTTKPTTPSTVYDSDVPMDGDVYDDVNGTEDVSYDEWEQQQYGSGSNYTDNMINSVNEAYDSSNAAAQAALQASLEATKNSINNQKEKTAQEYADLYRQLYLQNMQSKKNIGQQMAASGMTGGLSESTLLGLESGYGKNLNSGKQSEQNALSELEQAYIEAQASNSAEAANIASQNAIAKAQALQNAYAQAIANQQWQTENAQANASEDKSYAYQLALAMLQKGTMPSDDLLASAGISKNDANTIVAQVAASKASSGGSSTSGNYGDTYSQLLANAQKIANRDGRAAALAYLKEAYNSSVFDSISGSKQAAYNRLVNSINGMF